MLICFATIWFKTFHERLASQIPFLYYSSFSIKVIAVTKISLGGRPFFLIPLFLSTL